MLSTFSNLAKCHSLLLFFILAYALSWSASLIESHSIFPFGPLVAALIMTVLVSGKTGLTPFYPTEGNLFIVLFLLTLTAAGVIYGYMRLVSDSLWVPTLFHGAFNAFWDLFSSITVVVSPVAVQYLSGEAGLLTFLGTAAAAAYLIYRLEHRPVVLEQKLSASSL